MSVRDVLHMSTVNFLSEDFFAIASDVAAETAYPLTNAQNQIANMPTVIDMSSDTSVTISFTGSTDYTANSFCLWNHNLPSDNTIQLLLYPDASYGGTPYDSTALAVYHTLPWGSFMAGDPWAGYFEDGVNLKTGFSHYFDEVTFKSGKIVISAPTSTNDLISIDKLWLGPSYAFDYGYDHGSGFTIVDNSIHQPKPGGGMETVPLEAFRKMMLNFTGMADAEQQLVNNLVTRVGKKGDILLQADPNNTRGFKYMRGGIFRRQNDSSFESQYYNGGRVGYVFEEN